MDTETNQIKNKKLTTALPGLLMLFILLAIEAIVISFFIISIKTPNKVFAIITLCIATIIISILMSGFKLLKPNSAYIMTLFGKYIGTLEGPGFFYINPLAEKSVVGTKISNKAQENGTTSRVEVPLKTLSLKAVTLNNQKQKINDLNGNPIEIGIVVIWKVVDGAKAVFNVENFNEFLSIQSDSALRTIVRNYPYDCPEEDNEKLSLRGDSIEIAENLKSEIQSKVSFAGLEVIEAKITHLAYAQEIAAAMLQRQQASAIIDARKMIVDGAVGMVKMALVQLQEEGILELDEERKAAMVSNLLVVLCGNKDVQPIVNSGTLY